jgi:putative ABC transport system ATP-binding protein
MAIIEAERISKRYNDTVAVKSCDLQVGSGDILALLGPSGSGKTTLLRLIAGFERPDEGRIVITDRIVVDVPRGIWVPAEDRGVGMVFQDYALFPHLNVGQNVRFGLRNGSKSERQSRVEELLRLTELLPLSERYPHELSGGQQQRVAVARALASKPEIIFADEPTGNLDSRTGAEILNFMRQAVRDLGQTIVMVTHDPVAASYSDRAVFLADGQIVDELVDPTADSVFDRMRTLGA